MEPKGAAEAAFHTQARSQRRTQSGLAPGLLTTLPGFFAGGVSSSSLELSPLLEDGFLFACGPLGTSFLFLAAGDLRRERLSGEQVAAGESPAAPQ